MPVLVKICGITNVADALAVVEGGADALGFVFYAQSARGLSVQAAADIARIVPQHVVRTGVFVDADPAMVVSAIRECGLTLLQFHGSETPEYCAQFGIMSMKAFRVRGREVLEDMQRYGTEALLLDAWSPAQLGGSGEGFDWDIAVEAKSLGKPLFLAGGLTAENVARAVERVQPFAVDVSSGVELSPGLKDHQKVARFIQAAKAAV